MRPSSDRWPHVSPSVGRVISVSTQLHYAYSVFAVLTGRNETLFWELSTLIAIMLLGHWTEMRAVAGTQGALQELAKLLPDTAEVVRDGRPETDLVSITLSLYSRLRASP